MLNISNSSIYDRSLGKANLSEQMVVSAIDAIQSRIALDYFKLMKSAEENPGKITDFSSSLYESYENMSLSSEIIANITEAQKMAPNCKVITKKNFEQEISVYSENEKELDTNNPLDKAKIFVSLRIKSKDVKQADSLDFLLSELSKTIFSLGYGEKEGTFDIRLEKGIIKFNGDSWQWHYDGEVFKTSITTCYSNLDNWSTRILDSKMQQPAKHGYLYDALKTYHRAPIPSDLQGLELKPKDYRLFIRYNEFHAPASRNIERIPSFDKSAKLTDMRSISSFFPKKAYKNHEIASMLQATESFSTISLPSMEYSLLKSTPDLSSINYLKPISSSMQLTSAFISNFNFNTTALFNKLNLDSSTPESSAGNEEKED